MFSRCSVYSFETSELSCSVITLSKQLRIFFCNARTAMLYEVSPSYGIASFYPALFDALFPDFCQVLNGCDLDGGSAPDSLGSVPCASYSIGESSLFNGSHGFGFGSFVG